jgi:hypothetical protein
VSAAAEGGGHRTVWRPEMEERIVHDISESPGTTPPRIAAANHIPIATPRATPVSLSRAVSAKSVATRLLLASAAVCRESGSSCP